SDLHQRRCREGLADGQGPSVEADGVVGRALAGGRYAVAADRAAGGRQGVEGERPTQNTVGLTQDKTRVLDREDRVGFAEDLALIVGGDAQWSRVDGLADGGAGRRGG